MESNKLIAFVLFVIFLIFSIYFFIHIKKQEKIALKKLKEKKLNELKEEEKNTSLNIQKTDEPLENFENIKEDAKYKIIQYLILSATVWIVLPLIIYVLVVYLNFSGSMADTFIVSSVGFGGLYWIIETFKVLEPLYNFIFLKKNKK